MRQTPDIRQPEPFNLLKRAKRINASTVGTIWTCYHRDFATFSRRSPIHLKRARSDLLVPGLGVPMANTMANMAKLENCVGQHFNHIKASCCQYPDSID